MCKMHNHNGNLSWAVWMWIAIAYGLLALLVLLRFSVAADEVVDVRWLVPPSSRTTAAHMASAVAAAQMTNLAFTAFTAGRADKRKRPVILVATAYCALAALVFGLDGFELLYRPRGLELGFYLLAIFSGWTMIYITSAVLGLHTGLAEGNRILRKLAPLATWYFLWPTPRYILRLWKHDAAVPLAAATALIVISGYIILVSSRVDDLKSKHPVHWSIVLVSSLSFYAWIAVEVTYLCIAAGLPVSSTAGLTALHIHAVLTVMQMGITVSDGLMTYDELSRVAAERDAAQAALHISQQQQVQARAAEEARQKFLRYVFHELRVPFNSLDMGLNMLLEDIASADMRRLLDVKAEALQGQASSPMASPKVKGPLILNEDDRGTLDIMAKAAASMKVIINDTLDWTKLQSGAFQISLGPARISDVVGSSVVGLSNFAMHPDNKVKIVQDIDPRLPTWFLADKVRLQQVVANFLSNAIKFAPHDGTGVVAVKVHVVDGVQAMSSSSSAASLMSVPGSPGFELGSIWWKDSDLAAVLGGLSDEQPAAVAALHGSLASTREAPSLRAAVPKKVPSFRNALSNGAESSAVPGSSVIPVQMPHSGHNTSQPVSPPKIVTARSPASSPYRNAAGMVVPVSTVPTLQGGSAACASSVTSHDSLPSLQSPSIKVEHRAKLAADGFRFVPCRQDYTPDVLVTQPAAGLQDHGPSQMSLPLGPFSTPPDTSAAVQMCTVIISVKDNGEGILVDEVPSLFQAFRQLDAGMQYKGKGTGLGLAICHEIVSLHGGRVGVRSSGIPGEGAEFLVALRLPVLERDSRPARKQSSAFSAAGPQHFSNLRGRASAASAATAVGAGSHNSTPTAPTHFDPTRHGAPYTAGPSAPVSRTGFAGTLGHLFGHRNSTRRAASSKDNSPADSFYVPGAILSPEPEAGRKSPCILRASAFDAVGLSGSFVSEAPEKREGQDDPYEPHASMSRSSSRGAASLVQEQLILRAAAAAGYAGEASVLSLPGVPEGTTADTSGTSCTASDVPCSIRPTPVRRQRLSAGQGSSDKPPLRGSLPSISAHALVAALSPSAGLPGPAAGHPTIRILCADDVADSRKLLGKSLKRRLEALLNNPVSTTGHRWVIVVDEAEDGHIAVEMVTGRSVLHLDHPAKTTLSQEVKRAVVKYDVITMDAEMPTLSGFTATTLIRSSGFDGLLYGCTGNALEEDQQLFKRCGANDVYIKPLDIAGIAQAVHRWVCDEGEGLRLSGSSDTRPTEA